MTSKVNGVSAFQQNHAGARPRYARTPSARRPRVLGHADLGRRVSSDREVSVSKREDCWHHLCWPKRKKLRLGERRGRRRRSEGCRGDRGEETRGRHSGVWTGTHMRAGVGRGGAASPRRQPARCLPTAAATWSGVGSGEMGKPHPPDRNTGQTRSITAVLILLFPGDHAGCETEKAGVGQGQTPDSHRSRTLREGTRQDEVTTPGSLSACVTLAITRQNMRVAQKRGGKR